jgi:hypothetical protein
MEQRANIKFRFKTGKTATETFQLTMVTMLFLVHGFLKGMQDFGMVVKISKMTNIVDGQQQFEHLT